MNKSELIQQVEERAGLNKKQASDAVSAVLNALTDALQAGDRITLVGFGTFDVGYRAARTGVNPKQPTEKVQIAEKASVKFKAGKELATVVDNESNKSKHRKADPAAKKTAEKPAPKSKTTTKKK